MQHCMLHNIAPLSHSLYNNYPNYNIEQVINVPSLSIPLEEATMNLSGDLAGQIVMKVVNSNGERRHIEEATPF